MSKKNGNSNIKTVLVTGGAGYVGSVTVPKLVFAGYRVKVLDLYIYGQNVLSAVHNHPQLEEIQGDIRDTSLLKKALEGVDAVIHLACISNDPSCELKPNLSKTINYDAFLSLVDIALEKKVKRFIYASSSSVYGVKEEAEVTEDLPLEPLTHYSKYKVMCEEYLLKKSRPGFTTFILRPATICGYSPRLRLDLTVNILTASALRRNKILVYGGEQMRPNLHIEDMADLYLCSLQYPSEKIQNKIFNAGYQNYRVMEIAEMIRHELGTENVEIERVPTKDIRSYRISSKKIQKELGFVPQHSVEEAIRDLKRAFAAGEVPDPEDMRYYNIKTMNVTKLN